MNVGSAFSWRAVRLELPVHVGPRVRELGAEVERLRAGRVGGVEVAAPRLDRGELAEVAQREMHCAVAAGRHADERTSGARPDRAKASVDDVHELACDRGIPAVARPLVEVLRVGLAVRRALGCDEDRRAARGVQGLLHEADSAVARSGRG